MTTVKADERKRIVIPCAEPGQEFVWREAADGTVILRPMHSSRKLRKGIVRLKPGQVAALPDGLDAAAFQAGIVAAVREEREG